MKLRCGKEIKFCPTNNKRKNNKMTNKGENGGGSNHGEEEETHFDFKIFNAMIPMFRGNKNELRKFIDSGDLYFETLSDAGQEEFERVIMLKLDNYIYNWCQNKGVDSWETIKENLKRKYKTASNLPLLQKELFTIKQERRQSVGQFAEEIERKLFEMNEVAKGEIEEFDVGRYKQYHEKLALRAFQDGLKGALRMYIKARNFQTLSEAITEAMNEEAYTDVGSFEKEKEGNITCFRCGRKGHVKNQCYARINDENRYGENRNRTNEWNRNNNFNAQNSGGRAFQEYRNNTNRGNYRSGNFENAYRNNRNEVNQTDERRERYGTRPDQRSVQFAGNVSKNGERMVGRIHHPTI